MISVCNIFEIPCFTNCKRKEWVLRFTKEGWLLVTSHSRCWVKVLSGSC